jgi:cholinesterase
VSCPAIISWSPLLVNLSDLPYEYTPNGLKILTEASQIHDTFGEDCLTLNVWTKPQTGEARKAVMVWIYGGGFTMGGSDNGGTNGARLADEEDVVLVSIKYVLYSSSPIRVRFES